MATTLRDLLIQRAARLQERPALTAPEWGCLSYAQLRNRAEGVAFGLLGAPSHAPSLFSATGTAWDWAAELATAALGLVWDTAGQAIPAEVLGGAAFHAEAGRGPYHDREKVMAAATPFHAGLDHGTLMGRLRRLNVRLEWDHDTRIELPVTRLGEPPVRAALWSGLYAGAHLVLGEARTWDDSAFLGLWRSDPIIS